MSVIAILAVTMLLAFLVESLTEYLFGAISSHIPAVQPYSWLIMYVAAGVGVLGAFIYEIDFIHLLGEFLGAPQPVTTFGMILSGLGVGRGANYIHDIVVKYFVKPE